MKRLVVLAGLLAALVLPAAASAHPLGNFTVNRFARVQVSGHTLYVRYVLDMAEIPTYQARQQGVGAGVYALRIARGLRLTVDDAPARLVPVRRTLAFPAGAAGLHTLRLEVVLRGPEVTGSTRVTVDDRNEPDRLGWREVVVGAHAPSVSDELRAYPKSLLSSPLRVTRASAVLRPTSDPPPPLTRGPALRAPDRVADSGFATLIARRDLSGLVLLGSLAAALFWGAAHALSPGHGKTIVTAYLVGQRGTPRHAALLGLIVTATHTVGVFALGLVTLALSQFVVPDRLYPWLNLTAGALVVSVGLAVLRQRVAEWRHDRAHRTGLHLHVHGHVHDHTDFSRRGLLAVGISGGLLPCPSALVVLLAAISLHRLAFGLVLILAFSVGLAAAITGVGLLAVLAKRTFARRSFEGPLVRALPVASALVILVFGLVMSAHALPELA